MLTNHIIHKNNQLWSNNLLESWWWFAFLRVFKDWKEIFIPQRSFRTNPWDPADVCPRFLRPRIMSEGGSRKTIIRKNVKSLEDWSVEFRIRPSLQIFILIPQEALSTFRLCPLEQQLCDFQQIFYK